jgi:hypothetical protein
LSISAAGVITVQTSEPIVIDSNDAEIVFQAVDETDSNAGFLRATLDVTESRKLSVFMFVFGGELRGISAQEFLADSSGALKLAQVDAMRRPSEPEVQFFTDLQTLGEQSVTLVERSNNVSLTPFLCDQRRYTAEVPTQTSERIVNDVIIKDRPVLKLGELLASYSRNTENVFRPFDYVYGAADGVRTLQLGRLSLALSDADILTVSTRSTDLSESSIYTNDSDRVAQISCPGLGKVTIRATGLQSLVDVDLSDGFIRTTATITANELDSGGALLATPVLVEGVEGREDVLSITLEAPIGFSYSFEVQSSEQEFEFCTLSSNATGSLSSSESEILLTCDSSSSGQTENTMICPAGNIATSVSTIPTITAGDSDGNLILSFANDSSPIAQGTSTRFTVSSSGRLFIDNEEVSTTPYVCGDSRNEILWTDSAAGIVYAMSLLETGRFNEFNLSNSAGTFFGQYTDDNNEFNGLTFDLSSIVLGN